jgi:hypothetical protein
MQGLLLVMIIIAGLSFIWPARHLSFIKNNQAQKQFTERGGTTLDLLPS